MPIENINLIFNMKEFDFNNLSNDDCGARNTQVNFLENPQMKTISF